MFFLFFICPCSFSDLKLLSIGEMKENIEWMKAIKPHVAVSSHQSQTGMLFGRGGSWPLLGSNISELDCRILWELAVNVSVFSTSHIRMQVRNGNAITGNHLSLFLICRKHTVCKCWYWNWFWWQITVTHTWVKTLGCRTHAWDAGVRGVCCFTASRGRWSVTVVECHHSGLGIETWVLFVGENVPLFVWLRENWWFCYALTFVAS